MRTSVRHLNVKRVAQGESPIRFGSGIQTGEAVLGAVGLPERSDYTAIGATVNTAARLQELCKQFAVDVVLSGRTASRLAGSGIALRPLGTTPVRGKSEAIPIFTIDESGGNV